MRLNNHELLNKLKNGTISEKVENPQQKWYHFRKWSKFLNKNGSISGRKGSKFLNKIGTISDRKGSKFLNKNGTISGKDQKSSTKMVPFLKRAKIPQQKCYHFSQKRVKIPQQKMVPFQKRIKNPKQKWYHFRKGRKSSTKMIPFLKRVKIPQQKCYHFSQ